MLSRVFIVGLFMTGLGCVNGVRGTDTSDPGVPGGPTAPTAQSVAYTDLQPFFATDCFQCHGQGRAFGGYSMNTYAEVMKDVRPGDAASKLVVTTQPSGSMYQYFTGDAAQKADLVFNWVVVYNAQPSH